MVVRIDSEQSITAKNAGERGALLDSQTGDQRKRAARERFRRLLQVHPVARESAIQAGLRGRFRALELAPAENPVEIGSLLEGLDGFLLKHALRARERGRPVQHTRTNEPVEHASQPIKRASPALTRRAN